MAIEALKQVAHARGGFRSRVSAKKPVVELPAAVERPARWDVTIAYEMSKVIGGKNAFVALAEEDSEAEQAAVELAEQELPESMKPLRVGEEEEEETKGPIVAVVSDAERLREACELVNRAPAGKGVLVDLTGNGATEESGAMSACFSFQPLAIQTLFGRREGCVTKLGPEEPWRVFAKGEEFELAGRMDHRPGQKDIEESLYTNAAAKSPINRFVAWASSSLRGSVSK